MNQNGNATEKLEMFIIKPFTTHPCGFSLFSALRFQLLTCRTQLTVRLQKVTYLDLKHLLCGRAGLSTFKEAV